MTQLLNDFPYMDSNEMIKILENRNENTKKLVQALNKLNIEYNTKRFVEHRFDIHFTYTLYSLKSNPNINIASVSSGYNTRRGRFNYQMIIQMKSPNNHQSMLIHYLNEPEIQMSLSSCMLTDSEIQNKLIDTIEKYKKEKTKLELKNNAKFSNKQSLITNTEDVTWLQFFMMLLGIKTNIQPEPEAPTK